MKTAFVLAAAAIVGASALPTLPIDYSKDIIPGEFIVRLKPTMTKATRLQHMLKFHDEKNIINQVTIGDFMAYTFKGSENERLMLEEMDDVMYVENNAMAHAFDCELKSDIRSWGVTRVNNRPRPNYDGSYRKPIEAGRNADSYVLDTGIRMSHQAFGNIGADRGVNCLSGTCSRGNSGDGNGHGTHVAGTMAGDQFGLAQRGDIHAVKVLGDNGSGSWAGVIAGIEYAAEDCKDVRRIALAKGVAKGACVANLSLGGGRNQAINDAVDAAVREDVVMVVAAGNENQDACNVSPASAPLATTVGSTTNSDARSSFSNWGDCVDVFAPGSSITSAWHTSDSATSTISGTSMAAPHVAGIAQVLTAQHPDLPSSAFEAMIQEDATPDVVSDPRGTVNLMAHLDCE